MKARGFGAAVACRPHHPDPLWAKIAWVRFLQFLTVKGRGARFVADEAWTWCEAHSLPAPRDRRAYGFCTRQAADRKLIVDTNERPKAGSHGREVTLWEVL